MCKIKTKSNRTLTFASLFAALEAPPLFPPLPPLPVPRGFLGLIPSVVLTDGPLQLRFGRSDSFLGSSGVSSSSSTFTSLNSSLTSRGTFLGLPRFLGVEMFVAAEKTRKGTCKI